MPGAYSLYYSIYTFISIILLYICMCTCVHVYIINIVIIIIIIHNNIKKKTPNEISTMLMSLFPLLSCTSYIDILCIPEQPREEQSNFEPDAHVIEIPQASTSATYTESIITSLFFYYYCIITFLFRMCFRSSVGIPKLNSIFL